MTGSLVDGPGARDGGVALRRHHPEAVLYLVEAERVAPELLRYYVTSHVIIRDLLRRERRTQTLALRPLAVRAGVL